MKRFYETAHVRDDAGAFGIRLDTRELKTPAKKKLRCPTKKMAQLIADEWQAQEENVLPDTMPVMRLVATAIDGVETAIDETANDFAAYGLSDLLCYRAAHPEKLVKQQEEAWTPMLDWAQARFEMAFTVTSGVLPVTQPDGTYARLVEIAGGEVFRLAGLSFGAPLLESAILTLALAEAKITAQTAYELSQLDDIFQMQEWGGDEELTARLARRQGDIVALSRYFEALAGRGIS